MAAKPSTPAPIIEKILSGQVTKLADLQPEVQHESINTGISKIISKADRVAKFLELAVDISQEDVRQFKTIVEREYTCEQRDTIVKRINKAKTVVSMLKGG